MYLSESLQDVRAGHRDDDIYGVDNKHGLISSLIREERQIVCHIQQLAQ